MLQKILILLILRPFYNIYIKGIKNSTLYQKSLKITISTRSIIDYKSKLIMLKFMLFVFKSKIINIKSNNNCKNR